MLAINKTFAMIATALMAAVLAFAATPASAQNQLTPVPTSSSSGITVAQPQSPTLQICKRPCFRTCTLSGTCRCVCKLPNPTSTTTTTSGTPVSEPGMMGLFGMALGALGFSAYRRRKARA